MDSSLTIVGVVSLLLASLCDVAVAEDSRAARPNAPTAIRSSPADAPADKSAAAEAGPGGRLCITNFTVDGGFWTGKTFKSFQQFAKLDRNKAFERVAQQVAIDGWQGVNANKDLGIITATQTVTHGQGKQAPLNVVLKSVGSELRIDVVFSTSGGLAVSENDMKDEFCKLLESADR